jgi:hypothetical protein
LPNHNVHGTVSKLVLGRSYPSVDKAVDWPVRFLGASHRRLFHTVPESFIIGIISSQSLEGGISGIVHVILGHADSRSKGLVRCFIEGARRKQNMEERDNPSKKRTVWIVDYDLIDKPCRRQFYREVRKVLGETGLAAASSSRSVVAVKDEKTARTVYALAAACGISHLYQATPEDAQTKNASKLK